MFRNEDIATKLRQVLSNRKVFRQKWSNAVLFLLVGGFFSTLAFIFVPASPPCCVSFYFKKNTYQLSSPRKAGAGGQRLPQGASRDEIQAASNVYYETDGYVEIIRQDHPYEPRFGIALGFAFDVDTDTFPFYPNYAVLQLKDFTWGGVDFSRDDTLNFTGVTNDVSNDLAIEVTSFQNDTISGHFSGLLLSGGDRMEPIDSGFFRVKLIRR